MSTSSTDNRRIKAMKEFKRTDADVQYEDANPLDKSDRDNSADGTAERRAPKMEPNIPPNIPFEVSRDSNTSESDLLSMTKDSGERGSGFIKVNSIKHNNDNEKNGDDTGKDANGDDDDDDDVVAGGGGNSKISFSASGRSSPSMTSLDSTLDSSILAGQAAGSLRLVKCNSTSERYESFQSIKDEFKSVREVSEAMKDAGVEECNLILGIDYTLSNKIQGQKTFKGMSLHDMRQGVVNPYKEVICIFGETLEGLKPADAEISVFGFGKNKLVDLKSQLKSEKSCTDFSSVLDLYEEYTKSVTLGGPTDFAPIIYESIKIVERTKKYHILLIIADGQVTREAETIDAIIEASKYPLSIVVVGVGDGPWKVMNDFDDNLPQRNFDNFQFVEFHSIKENAKNPETEVALMALMEIPQQFKYISTELNNPEYDQQRKLQSIQKKSP